jgi:hypothetical protein
MMHGRGKSDSAIVAAKLANNAERSAAEPVEPRAETKGNAGLKTPVSIAAAMPQRRGGRSSCLAFIARPRGELLNQDLFRSLPHARAVLEAWGRRNAERPHSSKRRSRPSMRNG